MWLVKGYGMMVRWFVLSTVPLKYSASGHFGLHFMATKVTAVTFVVPYQCNLVSSFEYGIVVWNAIMDLIP